MESNGNGREDLRILPPPRSLLALFRSETRKMVTSRPGLVVGSDDPHQISVPSSIEERVKHGATCHTV